MVSSNKAGLTNWAPTNIFNIDDPMRILAFQCVGKCFASFEWIVFKSASEIEGDRTDVVGFG